MDELADRLDRATDLLTTVERQLFGPASAEDAFGAVDPGGGLPARLGRELHAHWTAVLDARRREAAGLAAQLADAARSVRATRRHYADTDDLVRRRLVREM